MPSRRFAAATAAAVGTAAVCLFSFLTGCGSGAGKVTTLIKVPTPTPTATVPVSTLLVRTLTVSGNQGVTAPVTLNSGAISPACSGAAPTVTAASNPAQVVRGGSFTVFVTSPVEADRLLVGVSGYDANLSADLNANNTARAVSSCCSTLASKYPTRHVTQGQKIGSRQVRQTGVEYQAVVSLPSNIPASVTSFTLTIATEKNGVQSCIATLPVQIVAGGQSSSTLQVSLSWNAPVDIDLHVETPGGDEIYYGNQEDNTGGSLDVDSNAGCSIDNIDQENISWGAATPPSGTYRIRPELFSDCGLAGPFPYVVTINNNGVQSIVRGTFVAADDNNGVDKSFTIQVGSGSQ